MHILFVPYIYIPYIYIYIYIFTKIFKIYNSFATVPKCYIVIC